MSIAAPTTDLTHREIYEGATLAESLNCVSRVISHATQTERVSILLANNEHSSFSLISTSTTDSIDPKARHARELGELVSAMLENCQQYQLCESEVRSAPESFQPQLKQYFERSGSTSLFAYRLLHHAEPEGRSVAILFEEFGAAMDSSNVCERLNSINSTVCHSIQLALIRDAKTHPWKRRFRQCSLSNRLRIAAFFVTLVLLAMAFLNATLWIPAKGRVVARQSRSLYAPTDAIVAELMVNNGDFVKEGDSIAILTSQTIESKLQQIDSDLSSFRSALASAVASRSKKASSPNTASSESTLRSRIDGLQKQRAIVVQQLALLTIRSPIDGKVSRWNMQRNLLSRPVSRGQFLVDVIDPKSGFNLELQIAEGESGYIVDELDKSDAVLCHFSMRASSGEVGKGVLRSVTGVSQPNSKGEWVMRGLVELKDTEMIDGMLPGSTANVSLDCGRRSLGFVWLRGFFEWWRKV